MIDVVEDLLTQIYGFYKRSGKRKSALENAAQAALQWGDGQRQKKLQQVQDEINALEMEMNESIEQGNEFSKL